MDQALQRSRRARLQAVALGAAALAACGGSSNNGGNNPPPVDSAVGSDASIDVGPQQTACQQQHLVCGRLGTEVCGTCEFTATCLPDQTGCLAATPVANAFLNDVTTTVEFSDRRFVLGSSGLLHAIYEIDDVGTGHLVDTETNDRSTPIISALGQSDHAVLWAYEDGTIQAQQIGGSRTTFTKIADSCISVAATPTYVLCGLLDFTNSDQHNNGVWRYPVNDPTAAELVAPRMGLVYVKAHGDTAYYTNLGGGPIGMFKVSSKAPIAVTNQAPAFVTATFGVIGNNIVVVGGATTSTRELWTIALDGSAAQKIAALDGIEVIGTGETGAIVRSTSDPRRVGVLSLETGQVATLIQHTDQDVASGTSRGGAYWFVGVPGPVLLKLTQ